MLFNTMRQSVLEVEAMNRDMIEKLPQFKKLFAFVEKSHLGDVVWNVLGGVPADYEILNKWIARSLVTNPSSVQSTIGEYLCYQVYKAICIVDIA